MCVCVCIYYVCVCVCAFIKLHITAQSGPVIYSFYSTACNPPGGYLLQLTTSRIGNLTQLIHTLLYVMTILIVNIFLARNVCAYSYSSFPHYEGSRPEPHFLDINYNVPGESVCVCVCVFKAGVGWGQKLPPTHAPFLPL